MAINTTATLVEGLLNGTGSGGFGYNGNVSYDVITEAEAAEYTLESGAERIAQRSREELHELFELAIIQTNEAVLGAKVEGYDNVMESATYGPVFEEAERTLGQKVIDFFKKLADRVAAFFQNLFTKLSEACHNYDKFLKEKGDALGKAKGMSLNCIDWNDKMIDGAPALAGQTTSKSLDDGGKLVMDSIKKLGADSADITKVVDSMESASNATVASLLKAFGMSGNIETDMSTLNGQMAALFRSPDKKKQNITPDLLKSRLTGVKKATDSIRSSQKTTVGTMKKLSKTAKDAVHQLNKDGVKGGSQLLSRFTSMSSKMVTINNAYCAAAIRATISRANEAQAMSRALISGKAGSFAEN